MTDQEKITVIYWLMGGCILVLLAMIPVIISFGNLVKKGSPLKDKTK